MTGETLPPLCDATEAACTCDLDAGHSGPHRCDCGGSWTRDAEGNLHVVHFPGPFRFLDGLLP